MNDYLTSKNVPFLMALSSVMSIFGLTSAIEMPEYEVEKKDENFEVRKYPAMTVAATSTSGQNSGFGKLFKFISGENQGDQKIAMTSPVLMPATAEGETREMMFLVPKKVVVNGVPEPKSENVSIKTVPEGRFAVIRSAGRLDDKLRKALLSELRAKVKEHSLEAVGDPIYAGYDPPWTPPSKRRNEVMLRIK